ncbi:MAG TPA: hypothetical protein VFS32_02680 [Candidatus Limnocylindrales bacterium]|nr:hypothetical protein [Candidatus Limnocylindrales bacterium]
MPEPATWRATVLVFRQTDAGWRTPSGRRGRTARIATDEELATIVDQARRVPAAVEAWSEGAARIEPLDVRIVERPLVSLSPTGPDALWAGPDDVRAEIDRLDRARRTASLFVVWPSDGRVPLCGWGCSIGPSREVRGAGFSSIVSDEWLDHARRPFPEEGFVHEWLHQVEGTLRGMGVGEARFPNLHDAEIRTSCRPRDEPPYGRTYRAWHDRNPAGHSWQEWYADWMTGRVRRDDGTCYGLTPALWREAAR